MRVRLLMHRPPRLVLLGLSLALCQVATIESSPLVDARLAVVRGDTAKAVKILDDATRAMKKKGAAPPKDPAEQLWLELGKLYIGMKKFGKAEACLACMHFGG